MVNLFNAVKYQLLRIKNELQGYVDDLVASMNSQTNSFDEWTFPSTTDCSPNDGNSSIDHKNALDQTCVKILNSKLAKLKNGMNKMYDLIRNPGKFFQ